ncbi:methyltransferase family protein [Candidatus Latescibacterota bacterium]
MTASGFLKRHGIVRNDIKNDLRYFAAPALFFLTAGLSVCGWDIVRQGVLFAHLKQNYIGLTLLIFGLSVMIVAQVTLWRSYSSTLVIREDHKLITHGIYRFVRNPIYLGAIIGVVAGIPLYCSSVYGFLIMLVLIPIILNRIRMEESLLTEAFGDEHRKYKAAVRKLIPFIY